MPLSRNLGALTLLDPSEPAWPVTGVLYLYLHLNERHAVKAYGGCGVDVWIFSDLKQLQVTFRLQAILNESRAELILAGTEIQ